MQLHLFPEYDSFNTKVKDVDYVFVDEVQCSEFKQTEYSILPPKKYILYKSGGVNPYMPSLGNVFPYIFNTETNKVLSIRSTKHMIYPKCSITWKVPKSVKESGQQGILIQMHRIVAEAFVINEFPKTKKFVDHKNGNPLDYRPDNFRWVTQKENTTNITRSTKFNEFDEQKIKFYDK